MISGLPYGTALAIMHAKADVTLSAAHTIYIHKVKNACLLQQSMLLQQHIAIINIKI